MNCNLRVQAGPEIKGEVTSPSWENREKFAASREVLSDGGHTTEAWLYYKPFLANLIKEDVKKKKNKKKNNILPI